MEENRYEQAVLQNVVERIARTFAFGIPRAGKASKTTGWGASKKSVGAGQEDRPAIYG